MQHVYIYQLYTDTYFLIKLGGAYMLIGNSWSSPYSSVGKALICKASGMGSNSSDEIIPFVIRI